MVNIFGYIFTLFLECIYLKIYAAKSLQSCLTLCDPIDGSPPGSHPWDFPGKNTGVGRHVLLQCVKVKSESEVAQLCPTLQAPMDCSLPGSSIHGISQVRVLKRITIAFSGNSSYRTPIKCWQKTLDFQKGKLTSIE